MKNRDVIITVVVVILIAWLIVRHFWGEKQEQMAPTPAQVTEKVMPQQ